MSNRNGLPALILPLALALTFAAAPARAQSDAASDLDPLADASTQVASGLALSREQGAAGDLLGALATAERVMVAHSEAGEALLLHASLLCRLDDRGGARAELARLAGRPVAESAWAEVTAACGAMSRPVAPEGSQ